MPTRKVKHLRGKRVGLALKKREDVSLAGSASPTFEIEVYDSLCRLCDEMNLESEPYETLTRRFQDRAVQAKFTDR